MENSGNKVYDDFKRARFDELMKLIAKYDWAVEDMPDPYNTGLTREVATSLRNDLVRLASTN